MQQQVDFFSDQRGFFKTAYLNVQTEYPFYEPGNWVKGFVMIRVVEPTVMRCIEIEVKGKEKAAFTRYWTEQDGDRTVERHERHRMEKKFLHYRQPVYQFPPGPCPPGDYNIEFGFQLPMGLPASINTHVKTVRERPKAKVKYFVKAHIPVEGMFVPNMKYKNIIVIRQPPKVLKIGEQQMETSHITTCCCIDKGTSSMWAAFEKNVLTPQDVARATINVDNAKCELNCNRIKFFIQQVLTVRQQGIWGNHQYTYKNHLEERQMEGPSAGQGGWTTEMVMDLVNIKYDIPAAKKKRGESKQRSPEDMFMLSGVQSETHGRFINNEYFLCIECEYDGCTCCANLPDARMPITIVPICDPRFFGFAAPADWRPTSLGGFNFDLIHESY